jgi:hypothetical protein
LELVFSYNEVGLLLILTQHVSLRRTFGLICHQTWSDPI